MRDGWIIMVVLLGCFLTIFIPLFCLIAGLNYAQCSSQASKMELEYSWGPLQDCMVRVDGKFMPIESYKVVKLRPAS